MSTYPGAFKATPLVIGGALYVSTAISQVAAIDAGTGELIEQLELRQLLEQAEGTDRNERSRG